MTKLKLAEKEKHKSKLSKKNQLDNSGSKLSLNLQPKESDKQSAKKPIEKSNCSKKEPLKIMPAPKLAISRPSSGLNIKVG